MMKYFQFRWIAAAILLLAFIVRSEELAPVKLTAPVTTRSGPVVGEDRDGLHIFRGIPYAAAPAGPRRWKAPEPAAPWNEPRTTIKFGAVCPQPPTPVYGKLEPQSEDCLFLNIWTAAKEGDAKRPVMFWIHGGAFMVGAGSQKWYEGSELARRGVVVVTINYRVGPFGFLAHPALTAESPNKASGNYGIMDQIFALKWVRENIASFGGDPENITIFGESAGGASVCALMASPQARGLFHKAIAMSSSHFVNLRLRDKSRPELTGPSAQSMEEEGVEFAKRLGAAGSSDVLAAMRGASAEDLIKVAAPLPPMSGDGTIETLGVDGYVIPDQINAIFQRGEQAHVPYIAGDVADEGTAFAAKLKTTTLEKYQTFLNMRFGKDAGFMESVYPATCDSTVMQVCAGLCGDIYIRSSRTSLRQQAQVEPLVFKYNFTRLNKRMKAKGFGVSHGSELEYFFGNVSDETAYKDADRKLSSEIVGYITRFAASGDPNGAGAVYWPRFTAAEDPHLNFDSKIKVGHDLRKTTLDRLDTW